MRYLLYTACMLVVHAMHAQDCKFTDDKVDEFTKARLVGSEARIALNMHVAMYYEFRYVNGEYILQCHWSTSSIGVIGADESLYIKLANDSVLEFKSMEVRAPERNTYYTWVDMPYAATRAQFEQMAMSAVVKVRIYMHENYLEYEIDNRRNNQQKIMKAAACFVERTRELP